MRTASDYDCPAGRWIRSVLHSMGIDVVVDDAIRGAYAASQSQGVMWLPPGLSWPAAHQAVDRCFLYLSGGVEFAPEFAPHRPGRQTRDAVVVDIATARNLRRAAVS